MIRFALKTLLFDRGKLLIAVLGVVFSVVLVSIQGGLFLGLMSKASMLVDYSQADIWISRRGVENVDFSHVLPERWLSRLRAVPEVQEAQPLIVGKAMATTPDGGYEDVWVIGEAPESSIGFNWRYDAGQRRQAMGADAVTIDVHDRWKLGDLGIGDTFELNGRRARIAATTNGVLGFLVTPYLTTNINSARAFCSIPDHQCSYFLVKALPGQPIDELCRKLRDRLPEAEVMPAGTFGSRSRQYWMSRTGIGLSFGASTALGLVVGLVMVAQSLYAITLDRLSDYATLKAMGAHDREIWLVLVTQALAIALAGSIVGVAVTYAAVVLVATPVTPIITPLWLVIVGVLVNIGICLASASLPARRIHRVDAQTVLQG
ncbi:MAG: FtsX-like permease family protein [Planctomycetales bacterium]|nr:FtsX-like permease family protein [Planctomycetales bacterium]